MDFIDVNEAAGNLSNLLGILVPGDELILTEDGAPVARLATLSHNVSHGQTLVVHLGESDRLDELTLAVYCYRLRTVADQDVHVTGKSLSEWLWQAGRTREASDVNQLLDLRLPTPKLRRFLTLAIGWCPQCGVPMDRHPCPHTSTFMSLDLGQNARIG